MGVRWNTSPTPKRGDEVKGVDRARPVLSDLPAQRPFGRWLVGTQRVPEPELAHAHASSLAHDKVPELVNKDHDAEYQDKREQ